MKIQITHNTEAVAEAVRKRGEAAIADVDRAVWRAGQEIAREAVTTMPKFRSTTAAATGVEQWGPLEWLVRFGTHYAQHVEEGTGPGGWVPTAEMMDWIRMKGIRPRDPGMTLAELAQALQWHIFRNGINAQPFAQPALEHKFPRLIELVNNAVRKHLAAPEPGGTPA